MMRLEQKTRNFGASAGRASQCSACATELHANNFALRHAARALARLPAKECKWRDDDRGAIGDTREL